MRRDKDNEVMNEDRRVSTILAASQSSITEQTNTLSKHPVTQHHIGIVIDDPLSKLRVLVVDDAPMNRKFLIRLLQSRGFNDVQEAFDGVNALDQYRAALDSGRPYDVITMDFQMPNMDGPTATKKLRELGYKSAIIGVTGNAMTSDIDLFLRQGADKVLLKPVKIEQLYDAISGTTFC